LGTLSDASPIAGSSLALSLWYYPLITSVPIKGSVLGLPADLQRRGPARRGYHRRQYPSHRCRGPWWVDVGSFWGCSMAPAGRSVGLHEVAADPVQPVPLDRQNRQKKQAFPWEGFSGFRDRCSIKRQKPRSFPRTRSTCGARRLGSPWTASASWGGTARASCRPAGAAHPPDAEQRRPS
jgi:hypothetical protein